MELIFAAFTVLGGLLAVLAGAYGLWQTRRISGSGHCVMALVKPSPEGAQRPLLEFETLEGRIVEITSPVPIVDQGGGVRLWYDPGSPGDVVVDGHQRIGVDRGFVAVGLALVAIGLGLAAFTGI